MEWPTVRVVVPARNEAQVLPQTLPTLLSQDYPGPYHVYLVDDHSDDGTGNVARRVAEASGAADRLTVVQAAERPEGWAGKVWAMQQGIAAIDDQEWGMLLLTDADVAHPPRSLRTLVDKATSRDLDMVSVMVRLAAFGFWERLLVPAFVFFFAKLYPFRWVNDSAHSTAAAAGGCILLKKKALEQAGGLERIAGALIDDCALARVVKSQRGHIWLGLSRDWTSVRPYGGLHGVWDMVARSAFTQLRYSTGLLAGTVIGMALLYAVPPANLAAGLAMLAMTGGNVALGAWLTAVGAAAWALSTTCFLPMVRWYRCSVAVTLLLPLAGLLYALMTLDSAWRHWRGRGGAWKGRTYAAGS